MEPMMELSPTPASGKPDPSWPVVSLRAAQAPPEETTPDPGSRSRPTDSLRLSGRTPLDADRRVADRLQRGVDPALAGTGSSPRPAAQGDSSLASASGSNASEGSSGKPEEDKTPEGLTEEEDRQVRELEKRDAEVRAHEQAHLAAAGSLAQGGPKFTFETGPDGKRYATGGEVSIVMKTGRTPEETIRNAQQVQAAALAASDPSPTDRQTAAAAARMAQEARQQLAAQSRTRSPETPTNPQDISTKPNPAPERASEGPPDGVPLVPQVESQRAR